MRHVLPAGAFIFLYLGAFVGLRGETPDLRLDDAIKRLDDAVKEIALLKRMAADQDRRIAGLERTVRAQQSAILAAARPVPTVPWKTLEGWAAVKIGMSRAQVVDILGEPQSTDAVIDRQTLFYKEAAASVGHVVITDDRVSEVTSNRFRIYVPSPK
jgi:hypothetical protein